MMKSLKIKFILSFFLTLTFFINNSQDYKNFEDWRLMDLENGFYLYNNKGKSIEGSSTVPDFTIRISKNKEGTIMLRLDSAYLYRYEEGKNRVEVDIIIDDNEMLNYGGEIMEVDNEYKTRVYFRVYKGQVKFLDLFKMMQNGENLFVRTTGAEDPNVYKYSLNGFLKGLDALTTNWVNYKAELESENPFKSKDSNENPFRR
tara:strand:+ start:506 stop:1111 length:606 start_codon:yes stop_codon:yes gene_type:complete